MVIGGYKSLPFFKQSEIIYDFTVDQKLRWLEEKFIQEGGFRENLFRKRLERKRANL